MDKIICWIRGHSIDFDLGTSHRHYPKGEHDPHLYEFCWRHLDCVKIGVAQ